MILLGFAASENYSITSDDEEEIVLSPSRNLSKSPLTNKTIVLDMDLTLLCTIGDGSDISSKIRTNYPEAYEILVKRGIIVPTVLNQFGGSGKASHNDVIRRPGVEEFLTFCRMAFKHVFLWSAGQASYVYDTVRLVLDPKDRGYFDHVYTAQDILHTSIDEMDIEGSDDFLDKLKKMGFTTFTTKPLDKIVSQYSDVSLDRIVIVDDLICNFSHNPNNGVLIPPFSPKIPQIIATASASPLENMANDHVLFSLIHFFADDAFMNSPDVRQYDLQFFPEKS